MIWLRRTILSVCQPAINLKIIALGLFLSIFAYTLIPFNVCEVLQNEALNYCANDARYVELYRKKRNYSPQLKYILLWTRDRNFPPFPDFKIGQTSFKEFKCPHIDCYFTKDRRFFGGSLEKFDAILFSGIRLDERSLPKTRYDHQKYVYVNIESAYNYPVCLSVFDNYFNWTYTYKLNSDILCLYFDIRNKNNRIVGPRPDMKWIKSNFDNKTSNAVKIRWKQKSKAVVWLVSNCHALNQRNKIVPQIQKSLANANLSLQIYGGCGGLLCPRDSCWKIFERKYYFYLSFENSDSEDYITEKVLRPLQHYVIPIVYGGANYSRFLPPGSYLDATKLSPDELVAKMTKVISSLDEYMEYFKWQSEYHYTDATRENLCGICSALHNKTMMDTRTSYDQFREWWLPKYRHNCRRMECVRC